MSVVMPKVVEQYKNKTMSMGLISVITQGVDESVAREKVRAFEGVWGGGMRKTGGTYEWLRGGGGGGGGRGGGGWGDVGRG